MHLTSGLDALLEILDSGHIKASFSEMSNKYIDKEKPTIRGPDAAVCFTEQPLWALLATRKAVPFSRFSGYGIAYRKVAIFQQGGRPAWYVSELELGSEVRKGHKDWMEGRRIHGGKIPLDVQYLCVLYQPSDSDYGVDFTWEREWRIKPRGGEFKLHLGDSRTHTGAIIVKEDGDKAIVEERLRQLTGKGRVWASRLTKVISLETASEMLAQQDQRYGRIETWPD